MDCSYIVYNPNITMEFINDNPDKPWNFDAISRNNNKRYFR